MKQEIDKEFIKRMRVSMADVDISRAQLAKETGINPNTIHGYFREHRIPRADDALKIAKALGVSIQWLIFGEEKNVSPAAREVYEVIKDLPPEDIHAIRGIIFTYLHVMGHPDNQS